MNDTIFFVAATREEVHFNMPFRDFEIYQEMRNNRVPRAAGIDGMHIIEH